ncbi:MAG TPA: hypothetical protein VIK83_01155 [Coriobacteriia bacterium]
MSIDPLRPRRPLNTTPLSQRPSKVRDADLARPVAPTASLAEFLDSLPDLLAVRSMREVAAAILDARAAGKPVILGCGAHVVKAGLSPLVIDWLERGLVTGIAVNGAFVLHDAEIALGGATSENVEEALPGGTFGVTDETNGFVNDAVAGRGPELGVGAAVGQALAARDGLVRPEHSVALACARLGLPLTVTVAIGTDVNHMHPGFDGAAWGAASLRDFDTFVDEVAGLDSGGVFLLAGSAVLLPEVFLKALALLSNVGRAPRDFVSADFDMLSHYRALTQVFDRPKLFGAKTYFVQAPHELALPVLGAMLGRSK